MLKSLINCRRSQAATTCVSSYAPNSTVLKSATPVLFCTTKYDSSTTLYYKVLLQYYSVLQRTTPVLLCITKCYSSTTLCYKVLLCTTKYYSTTLYWKVLLQYYSVLLYKVLLQYDLVPRQYYCESVLQTTACTTKYYTPVLLRYNARSNSNRCHDPTSPNIPPLPRRKTRMLHRRHIWNVIYNAHSNRQLHQILRLPRRKTRVLHHRHIYEASFTMRGATGVTLQPHQMLRLPRKMTRQNCKENVKKQVER